MKIHCLFFLMLAATGFSQAVSVVDVTTDDLVFSIYNDKLYVTIPAAAPENANMIGMIDPVTALVENTFPIANDPGVMAISSDGQTIYTGLKATPGIRKFDVATSTAGNEYLLGSDLLTGNFYAEDIEVMPGSPNTIAVARRNKNFAPHHEGVAIFDNGVRRANVSQSHTGSNQIAFTSASQLVGFNNETTESRFRKLTVSATGVVQSTSSNHYSIPETINMPKKFSVYGNKAFFTNGKVVDFTALSTISGTFADVDGPGVFDPVTNLVCYASSDVSGNISLKFFSADNYALINTIPVMQVNGHAKSLVCFNGKYAFNTADKVVIVASQLGTPEVTSPSVMTLYPNPVNDVVNIHSQNSIDAVKIFNDLGQLVREEKIGERTDVVLQVNDLNSGIYFVNVSGEDRISTYKMIKL
jgi:hypothetical protein